MPFGREDDNLLGAVAVVLVQRGAVDRPAKGPGDERPLDPDPIDENGGQDAEKAHEAEHERVSRIDLYRVRFTDEIAG